MSSNGNAEMPFGATWRAQDPEFWDWMWRLHEGSAMTEAMLELVFATVAREGLKYGARILEIGCGAGHMLGQMLERAPADVAVRYLGIDISAAALEEAKKRRGRAPASRWTTDFVAGDFLGAGPLAIAMDFAPDLVIARGVLQHQSHWAPMVVAALRTGAPRAVMGIGYTTEGPRHLGGWKPAGHYDVTISLPLLRYEALAMGLDVATTPMPNPRRPKHREALAIFTVSHEELPDASELDAEDPA